MSARPPAAWRAALAGYRAQAAGQVAPATLRVRQARLARMACDLGGEPWAATGPQLAGWLEALPGTPATVKEYRTAARAFYRWAVSAGHMAANPVRPAGGRGYRPDAQWRDALALFASAQRSAGIAAVSIRRRCDHLARFASDTGLGPWQPVREHVAGWLDACPAGESGRAALRVSLRAFYKWAHDTGRIADDPSAEPSRRSTAAGVPAAWAQPLAGFKGYLRAIGRPETTVRLRMAQLGRFARDHAGLSPWEATLDDLVEWLAGKRWAAETRRGTRAALRAFYRWAVDTGRMPSSPAERLPVVRASAPCPRPAREDDYAAALARACPRDRLALRLAAELGMRRCEVAAAHSGDLSQDADGWALRVRGKGDRVRVLPLPGDLARALRVLPPGPAFPGREHGHVSAAYLGKRISALLPAGVTMHALRHRFATLAYGIDRDVFTVQQLLGHASPATTQRYVQVGSAGKRRLVEAVSRGAGA